MSCASVKNNYVPQTTQISFPELNKVNIVNIGDQMLRQGTATTTRGVALVNENNIGGFILSPGFYPQTGEDEKYIYTNFETRSRGDDMGFITINGGLFGQNIYPRGIRFSKEKQETCAIAPNAYGFSQPVCDTEYSYQATERPIVSSNNFQQTLIYSGRVGDKVRVSYREFSGNIARPAFSNEAEYDLSEAMQIAYKGAKIQILEADNEKIKYEVRSNFNLEN